VKGMKNVEKSPGIKEYDAYFSRYVNLLPEGDIVAILEQQIKETKILLQNLTETQGLFRYAPNKWSVKEIIGHLTDTERILGYTLLCVARGENKELPRYDKDVYVQNGAFDKQTINELLLNLTIVRNATSQLLKSLNPEDWLRRGIANGSEVTVRALASILAGHELHHCNIMKEFYFGSNKFPL
jgi:hypothetical protein